MHAELIVPGLLQPAAAGGATRHPALELLLARGRRSSLESLTLEQWLHQAFEQPGASLAAGALALAAHGGDAGEAWWARADPVHLRVLRDRVVVVPGEALQIMDDEARALIASLNAHFGRAAALRALDSRRWVVQLENETILADSPALTAAGRDAAGARGNEALLTEMQMLLHAHPVNEAREARGEPPVNSLWLWGGGRLPPSAGGAWRSVAASDPSALGLAAVAGMRREPLPASAAGWLERLPESGRHLVVLESLRASAALDQHAEHEAGVEALERLWFAPLLAALRAGRIGMVTVCVPAPGERFETVRGDLRRFWRRPRPIDRYAEQAA